MKKLLALVLALVMTLSLCVVSSNAAYTDAADVDYKEAVDVMSAIGVLKGYADGSFQPDKTVTRAEAAKVIAYLSLGADLADVLAGTGKVFSDVPASHWAVGYVEYCAGAGYVNGLGDGTFNPNGNVTAVEFAKMLLLVLGCDAVADKFVGTNWAINVAKYADAVEIFEVSSKINAPATREEIALYAFNAITDAGYFESHAAQTTTVNGVTVTSAGSPSTHKTDKEYYELNIKKLQKGASEDDFGRPQTSWSYGKKSDDANDYVSSEKVGTYVKTPVATLENVVTESALYAAIGVEGEQGLYDKYITLTEITEDGNNIALAESETIAKNDKSVVRGSQVGATVEVYKVRANEYQLVTYYDYLGRVSAVTAAKEDKGTKRSVTIKTGASFSSPVGNFETEDFAKGDYVIYNVAKGAIKAAKAAETLSGKVTGQKVDSKTALINLTTYTVGGEATQLSYKNLGSVTLTPGTSDGTWFVDTHGNIIAVKEAASATKYYGYLLGYTASTGADADLLDAGAQASGEKFKFVNEKGETVILDGAYETDDETGKITKFVAAKKGDTNSISYTALGSANWTSNTTKDILFAYELNAAGQISKVYAYAGDGSSKTFTKGTAAFNSKNATDKTVFFYVDDTNEKYAAYVGYAAAPTKTGNLYWILDSNTVKAAVLKVSDGDVGSSTAKQYVYFASTDYDTETTAKGTTVTYTNVYINGEEATIKFGGTQAVNVGDVWEFTTSATTGKSTLGTERVDGTSCPGTEITSVQSGYFYDASDVYYTDSETVYYVIDKTDKTMTVADEITAVSSSPKAYEVRYLYTDGTANNVDAEADVVIFFVTDIELG